MNSFGSTSAGLNVRDLRLLHDRELGSIVGSLADEALKADDIANVGERRRRHDLDRRPLDLRANRAQLERVFDERPVGRLIGDDEGLEGIRNQRRQRRRPDLGDGVRRETLVAPQNAIVRRDAIVLRGPPLDRVAGAKLLDVEVDVEQLELTQESCSRCRAATSAATAAAAAAASAARRTTRRHVRAPAALRRLPAAPPRTARRPRQDRRARHHPSTRPSATTRRSAEHVVRRREPLPDWCAWMNTLPESTEIRKSSVVIPCGAGV